MADDPDNTKQPDPAANPPFRTVGGANAPVGTPTAGLSQSPGLREVPDSKVPALGDGTMVSHVFGPGQTAVDPIAAGLDTGFNPLTRNSDRVITQTGEIGAGQRPSTYLQHGGALIPQAGPADHANVPAPDEQLAAASPGPNSTGGAVPETPLVAEKTETERKAPPADPPPVEKSEQGETHGAEGETA